MAYVVLVSDPLAEEGLERLKSYPDVEVEVHTDWDEERLEREIGRFDALLVRSGTQVTARIIDAGTRLKAIGRAGVGVDNIDVGAATKKGIIVINSPDGNTLSAAEHTVALMLSLARQIPRLTMPWSTRGSGTEAASPASRSRAKPWASWAWAASAAR